MAIPLIAAGVKVAGKALIKKLGTKLAQKGAQKVAQKLAQEGAKKITTSPVKKGTSSGIANQFQKAKNLYNKAADAKKTKDNITGEAGQKKQSASTTETDRQKSDTDQPQKKTESK